MQLRRALIAVLLYAILPCAACAQNAVGPRLGGLGVAGPLFLLPEFKLPPQKDLKEQKLVSCGFCGGCRPTIMLPLGGTKLIEIRPSYPPDPLPLIADAFLRSRYMELVTLDRLSNRSQYPAAMPYRLSDSGDLVTNIVRIDELTDQLSVFRLIAEAGQGPDEDGYFLEAWEREKLEKPEAIKLRNFAATLAIGFVGDHSLRVEFDFQTKLMLLEDGSVCGFYSLDDIAVRELQDVFSVVETEPNKVLVTTPASVTPAANALVAPAATAVHLNASQK